MAGTETLRYKDELDQVKDRIGGLLQQLESEEDPRAKQRLQKKVTRRVSRVVNLEPVEAETQPPETFHDVREKLDDLLGQLHLEERQHVLSQVVEWFVGHTPAAQKDIAVLERADKECLRRECERAWSALGTEDRMRKKERNTVRQVQQFVESVAREHDRHGDLDSDEEEDFVQFDQRLLNLSDERLTIELAQLHKEIANKEKEVMQIMLNIAERGSFLTAASIDSIRSEMEKQDGSSDLVAEQEKLWVLAEDELRQLEAHKDMIFETIGFVKGRMKGEDGKVPLTDEMTHFLKKKRQDVETKHGPGLLAKRMEDHGKELETPSTETLLRLQNETAELNQRIQKAGALNLKVTSESQLNTDFDKNLAALKAGAPPNLETLQQLADIMDPQKDWHTDNVADEDQRRVQIETERLMKKKADLLQIITRMTSEQQALQREWAEQWTSAKALEAKLQKQEEQVPAQEENLRVVQEQHELVAASLACARSNISAAATLKPPRGITSHARLPSLSGPATAMKQPSRALEDGDNASAASSGAGGSRSSTRQLSGAQSHGSTERDRLASASARLQRRTLLVDPGNPVPTWSPDAVVADGIGELVNAQSRQVAAEWVEVFNEDSVGRIRKSALVAQAALFSQLGKEQDDLKLEVEELERQVQDRVKAAKITTDGKAEEVARAAVQEMERQIKVLESIQSSLAGIESLGSQDLNRRMAYLERCTPEHPEQLPPFLQPMREAVLQEWENCDLLRQINNLAPETEKYRAQFANFKKSSEPSHRRRLSMMQKKENDIRKRNRKMRQACRELTVFREQVRIAREEASLPAEKCGS